MGPINSSHASAYYSEYNERFDLTDLFFVKSEKADLSAFFRITFLERINSINVHQCDSKIINL